MQVTFGHELKVRDSFDLWQFNEFTPRLFVICRGRVLLVTLRMGHPLGNPGGNLGPLGFVFLPPLTPRNGNSTEQNWISSLSKGIKRLEQYLSISLSPSIMEQWMRFVLAASYMSPSRKVSRLPFFWEGFACVGIVWVNGDHRDLHQQQRYTILERVYFWLHLYRELPVITIFKSTYKKDSSRVRGS